MAESARVSEFRRLHVAGCFVMPNPWDVGSARFLAQLGFKAIATSSAGFAWSIGRPDNGIRVEDALAHLRAVVAAVPVPVNADFEGGFADDPDGVAVNVTAACATGLAGLSIEDSTNDPGTPLYDFAHAVARVRAAREAIDRAGTGVLLTARSEGFIRGRPDRAETILRLQAFAEAGADCLFAPGLRALDDIRIIAAAVAPKPLNVIGGPFATVAELADAGVRRISTGGSLARVAYGAFLASAKEIAEQGTFSSLASGAPIAAMNGAFK